MGKMDLNDLDGPQRKTLREAIVKAFNAQTLDMLLQDNLNKDRLDVLVAPGDFNTQAFHLVRRTEMEGWTEELVKAMLEAVPNNARVRTLIGDLSLLQIQDADKGRLVQGDLERTVKEQFGVTDFLTWTDKLFPIRRKVCRVEDPSVPGKALGTGFLVGNDLVLTNYHVVEDYIQGNSVAQLRCRFDYAVESTGENPGKEEELAPGEAWLVDHAPYSEFDTGDQGGLPNPNELDYALLRLASKVGDDELPDNGGKRGWVKASTLPALPEPTDIVFIVQHPKGEALKLAVGAVIKRNDNNSRVRYDTNTDKGSSGSPCFDAKLDLVALHHGGDPDWDKPAEFNQGIPMETILNNLASKPDVPQFWQ
jgi:hypothetical protein